MRNLGLGKKCVDLYMSFLYIYNGVCTRFLFKI